MARLYRDVPLNSIWEGSGNVQCLDVLRAMHKEPETVAVLFGELNAAKGVDTRYDQLLAWIDGEFSDRSQIEARARRIVEALGLALQAAILLQHGHPAVRDAFCSSRLAGKQYLTLGTLPAGTSFDRIIERSRPKVN